MESFQVSCKGAKKAAGQRKQAIAGVNTSGNLEVLTERVLTDDEAVVEVATSVSGFRPIWEAVINDFFTRASPGGLRFSINDGGARPDTVSLRLMQSVRLMEHEQ